MDWQDTAKWLWGLLVPMGIALFKLLDVRIKRVETELEGKTDKAESERQRDHVEKIFEKLEESGRRLEDHTRRDEESFREILQTMNDHHAELLKALADKADR